MTRECHPEACEAGREDLVLPRRMNWDRLLVKEASKIPVASLRE
jgi:hypothetical protein